MSRPLRIEYENAVYHVMNRGRNHSEIFHGEIFYQAFLTSLIEANQRFDLQILAYCLMGNHYHLLLKTPRANLGRCMRHIDGLYTQRYNKLKTRDGSLFRGRYKAILIDADSYLLQVSRYIHRNPIETKIPLVDRLEKFAWSSYSAYINSVPCPAWLLRDEVLLLLNPDRKFQAYQEYTAISTEKELQDFYSKKKVLSILGNKGFEERIKQFQKYHPIETAKYEQKKIVMMDEVIQVVCHYYKILPEQLLQTNRGPTHKNIPRLIAIYISQLLTGETLINIAKRFRVLHYSTIGQTMHRFKRELKEGNQLSEIINVICQDLTP